MNKSQLYITTLCLLLFAGLVNRYIELEYNISVFEYFLNSGDLSEREKSWLKERGPLIYGADNSPPLRFLDDGDRHRGLVVDDSDGGLPPLRFIDTSGPQFQGMLIDYVRVLALELDIEIEFRPLVWKDALRSLSQGEIDLCDMFPSPARAADYLTSEAIYSMRGVVVIPTTEQSITHYSHLAGKIVGAVEEDYVVEFLQSEVEQIRFQLTADMSQALELLRQRRVQAIAGPEPVISYFLKNTGLQKQYRFLDPPLYENDNVLAVPKTEKRLRTIINKGIRNLKHKNTMEKIQQQWFGISVPFSRENSSEKIVVIMLMFMTIVSLILYLSVSWNTVLRGEVEKRTEELFNSKTNLQTTFDGLTYFMVVLSETSHIVMANKAFCAFAGVEESAIIGQSYQRFQGILDNTLTRKAITGAFSEVKQQEQEFLYHGKTYSLRVFPLKDQAKRVHRVLCMIKDVTTEKIHEKRLLHSNKMAAVGRLAAGVTHEIRNPLGLIRNHCYLLKKLVGTGAPPTQNAFEVIEQSVQRANSIIENLLNFSRTTDDKVTQTDVAHVIRRITALEHKACLKKRITVDVECAERLLCVVSQESLNIILVNLLSNAIDALPEGGHCWIEAAVNGQELELSCRDNGPGIPESALEQVFEPFYTTKPIGKGTGLGLYIVYNEVQKCGGQIWVESDANVGSTFSVKIPTPEGDSGGSV